MEAVSFPTLAPSVCVVCESVPPETPFVDTLNTFAPGVPTRMNGRKYICENCVRTAANALDLFEEAVAPVEAKVEELTEQVTQLQADVDSYEAIRSAIEQLSTPKESTTTPVVEVVEATKAKQTARKKAAAEAQATVNDAAEAEAAGAARQKQLEQEAADRQQAQVDAALNAPETPGPDLTKTAPADAPLPPVTPVGQNVSPENQPKEGQIWDGTAWVDPPIEESR